MKRVCTDRKVFSTKKIQEVRGFRLKSVGKVVEKNYGITCQA